MKKSGWLLLPAAFFLWVNFSVSGVKVLFASRLIYFLFLCLLFFLLRRFSLDKLLHPIVGGISLILFSYGIIQKFILFPYYLSQISPGEHFYAQALITRIKSGRIFSLFALPTLYAIICTVLIIFILHYLLAAKTKISRFTWAFLLLMGLFNLVLTQSFGGILYLSLGILAYLVISGILKFKYLAPVLMVLFLFLFIITGLRFSEAKEFEPVKLRFSNWKQATRMIESAPFWGVGLGNYEATISYYTRPAEAKSIYAHNFFLQFVAETGLLFPALLLMFLLAARDKTKIRQVKEKTVYLAVFLVVILYNIVDIGLYFFPAGVAAVIALSQVYRREYQEVTWKGNGRLIMNAAGCIVLGLLMIVESASANQRRTADFQDAQQEYKSAWLYYKKSLNINPFDYHSLVKAGQAGFRFHNPTRGEIYLDRALILYPYLAAANYLKSQIEFRRGHFFKAFFFAATAVNKYKMDDQYEQWYNYLKKHLVNLLETRQRSKKE
jgi:O-antigen ligase